MYGALFFAPMRHLRNMLRPIVALFILLAANSSQAQALSGRFEVGNAAQRWIVRLATRGASHFALDSVRVAADGTFSFPPAADGTGFYQLALASDDVVDIILNTDESAVELRFETLPLRNGIRVVRSDENERLWGYKIKSKELQLVQRSVASRKQLLQPTDTMALMELDRELMIAQTAKEAYLDRVLDTAPNSYFAAMVRADRDLAAVERKSPMDVLKVFDLAAPTTLRSAVYDRAVMTFLQNIGGVTDQQFIVGSDTLMAHAKPDPDAYIYLMEHLLDLYGTYGPERASQHIVDAYLAPYFANGGTNERLRTKSAEMLAVSIGATGPDLLLNDHGRAVRLSRLAAGKERTVLFFYSSTCDHCHHQVPVLKEILASPVGDRLQVVGIALDDDSTEFKGALEHFDIRWPSFSEFLGWGSAWAKAYRVKATPNFILLDEHLRIVSKPVDAEDLRRQLN